MTSTLPAKLRPLPCQPAPGTRLQAVSHHSTGGYTSSGRSRSRDPPPAPRTLQKTGFEKIPGYGSSPSTRVPASLDFPFTLQGLVVFSAVCSQGSVEAAATALGASASTVQFNVSQLERKLGLALLSKAHKSQAVTLTATGALLYRYAERILAKSTDLVNAARDLRELRTGKLHIAASQTPGVYHAPRLIGEYKQAHGQVAVNLQVENTRRCCLAVTRGECDLAIVGGEIPCDLEHLLQVSHWLQDEVVIIVSASHPMAQRGSITPTELQALRYVSLHRSSTVAAVHSQLERNGIQWRTLAVVMEVNSVEAMKSAVQIGLGAAFVSAAVVEKEASLGTLAALRIQGLPLQRQLQCITDPSRYNSLALQKFLELMFSDPEDMTSLDRAGLAPMVPLTHSNGNSNDTSVSNSSGNGKAHISNGASNGSAPHANSKGKAQNGSSQPQNSSGSSHAHTGNGKAQNGNSHAQNGNGKAQNGNGHSQNGRHKGGQGPMGAQYPALWGREQPFRDASPLTWGQAHSLPSGSEHSGSGPKQYAEEALTQLPFTLAQLVVFSLVARSGSCRAAGSALSMSQPGVSKSLASLEKALGVALVQRGNMGGRTQLSETGQTLRAYCDKALGVASEAAQVLQDAQSTDSGIVTLGASQTVATYLIPPLIAPFRQANPQITVQMQVDRSRWVCGAVVRGELDVALVGGEVPAEHYEHLQVLPYAEDELVLVVPPDSALAGLPAIDKSQLRSLTFLSLDQGATVQAAQEHALHRHGVAWRELSVQMEFNSIEAIKGAVQHGLGAAFVSAAAIHKETQLGLLHHLPIKDVQLTRTISLVINKKLRHSTAARKFLGDVFCLVTAADGCLQGALPSLPFRTTAKTLRPWEKKVPRLML